MLIVRNSTLVQAPIERVFALSCSIELVQRELKMRPVAGRTSGFVCGGDTVRWQGWQLGFPNYHVSLIVPETWDPPHFFQDRMIAGRFRAFEHDHRFTDTTDAVRLDDEVRFTMPLGWPGRLVGSALLVPHIRKLLHRRFALLKQLSEGEGWRNYLR